VRRARLGAALVDVGSSVDLLMVDEDGVLWCLASGSRELAVSAGRASGLLVFSSLADLVRATRAGVVCVTFRSVARRAGALWRVPDEGDLLLEGASDGQVFDGSSWCSAEA
jgi:hypothetical protein